MEEEYGLNKLDYEFKVTKRKFTKWSFAIFLVILGVIGKGLWEHFSENWIKDFNTFCYGMALGVWLAISTKHFGRRK